MEASRNLAHFAVLGAWAVLGALFSLKQLFGHGASLATVGAAAGWWLWFAAFAGIATVLVKRCKSAPGALAVHAGLVAVLLLLPWFGPFVLVRFGLDAILWS